MWERSVLMRETMIINLYLTWLLWLSPWPSSCCCSFLNKKANNSQEKIHRQGNEQKRLLSTCAANNLPESHFNVNPEMTNRNYLWSDNFMLIFSYFYGDLPRSPSANRQAAREEVEKWMIVKWIACKFSALWQFFSLEKIEVIDQVNEDCENL